jgi:hypothetical protein
MSFDSMIAAGMAGFKQKLEEFCQVQSEQPLTPEVAHAVTAGITEASAAGARAAFKVFLESKDVRCAEVAVGEERFRFKCFSEKTFMTFWGPETLTRALYQSADDTRTFVPLDDAWGMQKQFMAPEVREACAFAHAQMASEEAQTLLEKCALFHPHRTQIKRLSRDMEKVIDAHRTELDERIRAEEAISPAVCALAVSMDGANVLMREAGAKRGRPAERPMEMRQSENTAYRNAMVGTVTLYGAVPENEKTPERLSTRYVARMPEENAVTFKSQLEAEVAEIVRRLPKEVPKVFLCDAARSIWKYRSESKLFCSFEGLVDCCHALEHLSLAAEALFGKGTKEAQRWFERHTAVLIEQDGGAQRVLRSMEYYGATRSLCASQRQALDQQRTFFANNARMMTYADFRRRGLPIGSGPVEAACKTIIKQRFCQSGMRWSSEGGQAILDPRTYIKSGRWDSMWKHYNQLAQLPQLFL